MTSAERVLAFEAIENFRDYGGYPVEGGGWVRTGSLYRSAHHGRATQGDLDRLAALELHTVVDLRRRNEREREPCRRHVGFAAVVIDNDLGDVGTAPHLAFLEAGALTENSVHAFMVSEYERIPFEARHLDLYRRYFSALVDADGPVLIHCAAGKDRTGLLAALTHHALGVHDDDAMADFLLTNSAGRLTERAPEVAANLEATFGRAFELSLVQRFMGVHPDYLETARRVIRERHGSTEAYLEQALGVDAPLRERLRRRLIS